MVHMQVGAQDIVHIIRCNTCRQQVVQAQYEQYAEAGAKGEIAVELMGGMGVCRPELQGRQ